MELKRKGESTIVRSQVNLFSRRDGEKQQDDDGDGDP